MTAPIWITYICLLITVPIIAALAAGQDPMSGYAAMAGLLARAAGYGLELRKGLGL